MAWERSNPAKHTWFVFEEKPYRIQKSLSDLNGTDPQIHSGQVSGVLRELRNIFRRTRNQPTVPEMMKTYYAISRRCEGYWLRLGRRAFLKRGPFRTSVTKPRWPSRVLFF